MDLTDVIWLLIAIAVFMPMLQRRLTDTRRLRLIRNLERERGSRVITLIHRQESLSLLGVPLARYISVEDSEALLRAVRLTPDEMPIDIILHTPGGLALASEQIAQSLLRHKAKVTVMVPHYAMSGGTLIALAAREILMDRNAVLGPLDPQLAGQPAAAILDAVAAKPRDKIEDRTLILASVARKAMSQVRHSVVEILTGNRMPQHQAEEVADLLATGQLTHDYAIDFQQARAIGLPVRDAMPKDVYRLMDLYPQPARTHSVQYVPAPYDREAPARGRAAAGDDDGRR